ncbi:hypothetical protein V5799_014175 [Amblyomma americanum]|uniref:Uncharacterized protein n=1 Tax=Amblyomma americanum TaxID=6943 RepID=A0AAQ4E3T6_AMBAM
MSYRGKKALLSLSRLGLPLFGQWLWKGEGKKSESRDKENTVFVQTASQVGVIFVRDKDARHGNKGPFPSLSCLALAA